MATGCQANVLIADSIGAGWKRPVRADVETAARQVGPFPLTV